MSYGHRPHCNASGLTPIGMGICICVQELHAGTGEAPSAITDERVLNVRAWNAARAGSLSGAATTVEICDELLRLRSQLATLTARAEALAASEQRVGELLKAINDHNHECQRMCGFGDQEAVGCKYRPYFENTGRRCPDCPTNWKVDVPVAAPPSRSHGGEKLRCDGTGLVDILYGPNIAHRNAPCPGCPDCRPAGGGL